VCDRSTCRQSNAVFAICSDTLTREESGVSTKCTLCTKLVEKPTLATFGVSAEEAVRELRFRIYQETRLTASAGYY